VDAMSSKVILMMPKNQELSKFQRFKNQVSRIKIQDSRFKNQVSRIKIKIQESKEDSIRISTKNVFQKHWVAQEVSQNHCQRVLLSGNRLLEGSNRLPMF